MIVKRSTFEHVYTFGKKFYKYGFPIALAYAMTGYKSQGATISTNMVVNIRNAFAPRLTYVMLSRVTNRTNLKIKGRLLPFDFMPCKVSESSSSNWWRWRTRLWRWRAGHPRASQGLVSLNNHTNCISRSLCLPCLSLPFPCPSLSPSLPPLLQPVSASGVKIVVSL